MPESRKIFEEEVLLEPTMASVAYRGKVEERYQANALFEHWPEATSKHQSSEMRSRNVTSQLPGRAAGYPRQISQGLRRRVRFLPLNTVSVRAHAVGPEAGARGPRPLNPEEEWGPKCKLRF